MVDVIKEHFSLLEKTSDCFIALNEAQEVVWMNQKARDCLSEINHYPNENGESTPVYKLPKEIISKLESVEETSIVSLDNGISFEVTKQSVDDLTLLMLKKGLPIGDSIVHELPILTILNKMPEGIIVAEPDGSYFHYVNELMAHTLGYTDSQDLIGKDYTFLHPEDEYPKVGHHYNILKEGVTTNATNIRFLCADGSIKPLDIHVILLDVNGRKLVCGVFSDQKERILREKELHASRRKAEANRKTIELLLTSLPTGVAIFKDHKELIFSNAIFEELVGFHAGEIINIHKFWDKLIPNTEKRRHFLASWDTFISNNSASNHAEPLEIEITDKKATKKFVELAYAETLDYQIISMTEITKRKEIEVELERNRQQLNQITENTEEVIWLRNAQNDQILYISPAYERLFGQSSEALYKNADLFIDCILVEDRKQVLKAMQQYAITHKLDLRYRIKNPKTGKTLWIKAQQAPIRDETGVITGHTGIASDITELMQAYEQVRLSEERFRSMFQNNKSAMFLVDPENGKITEANKSALQFYGYNASELIGMDMSELDPLQTDLLHKISQLSDTHHNRYESVHTTANGGKRDVEVFSSLIRVGDKILMYEIVHDITDRNKYQKAVSTQNKILREIAWAQSHVMRAPLARMLGLLNLLEDSDNMNLSNEEISFMLQNVKHSAVELDHVLREMTQKTELVESLEKKNPT